MLRFYLGYKSEKAAGIVIHDLLEDGIIGSRLFQYPARILSASFGAASSGLLRLSRAQDRKVGREQKLAGIASTISSIPVQGTTRS